LQQRQLSRFPLQAGQNPNFAEFGELDGIADEIDEDLSQPNGIGLNGLGDWTAKFRGELELLCAVAVPFAGWRCSRYGAWSFTDVPKILRIDPIGKPSPRRRAFLAFEAITAVQSMQLTRMSRRKIRGIPGVRAVSGRRGTLS
jgi:hypothetical protein